MNADIIEAIKSQLSYARDNRYRARASFGGLTLNQLQEDYGHSGKSCQDILTEYEDEVQRWEKALADAQAMQ